ncbi:Imm63 family immunity protein [Paenibacillus bovis]|uniref:Uncharacterized protein n=1 Tax=Paenibacillus bovis TaxID=1616788 RepID=A0A172ZIR3_9BACL|nr:Imm63 family immunity protein [Paenibacillus bovis]ANF97282.1 hypothetical protein AR543_15585 [Paenibacillus bovis]
MSSMYTESQLIEQIIALLQQTDIYQDDHHRMVASAFSHTWRGDLEPHIKVEPETYRIQLYERGILSVDRPTTHAEDVIYYVLEEIIFATVHIGLLRKYEVNNRDRHLQYTDAVMAEINQGVNQAFHQIGGIYEEWHLAGRRSQLHNL